MRESLASNPSLFLVVCLTFCSFFSLGSFAVSTTEFLAPGVYNYQITQKDLGVESSKVVAPSITVLATTSATATSSAPQTTTPAPTTTCAPSAQVGSKFPFVAGTSSSGVNSYSGLAVDSSENVYAYGEFPGTSTASFNIQCKTFLGSGGDFRSSNPFLMK